jgi:gamma-glutamyl-gamma-aminobutyrate hydrolase PuuD
VVIKKATITQAAQLLNVMNGGSLYQDVNGHLSSHKITTHTGQEVFVTSSHHQMMRPTEEAFWLGWSDGLSSEYKTDSEVVSDIGKEAEVLYYPETKSLCIQPHPEWMKDNSAFKKMTKHWIEGLVKC